MRIVKPDAREYQAGRTYVDITPCIAIKDTIEISDAEWDAIGLDYRLYSRKLSETYKPLSQYLRELILLAGAKKD